MKEKGERVKEKRKRKKGKLRKKGTRRPRRT